MYREGLLVFNMLIRIYMVLLILGIIHGFSFIKLFIMVDILIPRPPHGERVVWIH